MTLPELLRWQWQGYSTYHRSRSNLLLHIFVVPLFLIGNLWLLMALLSKLWLLVGIALAMMLVSVILQGRGHALEAEPPVPFSGPLNAVARIFLEQWISFPRFVFTGGWLKALKAASVTPEVPK